jgi:hypothetical protein
MADTVPRRGYWQAQGLIERELSRYQAAVEQQNIEAQRRAFFHLAGYHGRTLHILTTALHAGNDVLAQSGAAQMKVDAYGKLILHTFSSKTLLLSSGPCLIKWALCHKKCRLRFWASNLAAFCVFGESSL